MRRRKKIKRLEHPTGIQDLTDDLLSQIFLKLSELKDLFHIRCVCRSFYQLCSNPYFVKAHHAITPLTLLLSSEVDGPNHQLQCVNNYQLGTPTIFKPKLPKTVESITVSGSCNGLLLLNDSNWPIRETVHICNPILGQYITLPRIESWEPPFGKYSFGFSKKSNTYKVVRFHRNPMIFTLGVDVAWRAFKKADFCTCFFRDCWLSLLGTIYWIRDNVHYQKNFDLLCAFDVEEENFRSISVTPLGLRNGEFNLGNLGNRLSIVHNTSQDRLDVWTMNENGGTNSWTKDYSFTIPSMIPRSATLTILREGQILMCRGRSCYSYDPKEKNFKAIRFGKLRIQNIFTPSFVSLNGVLGLTGKPGYGNPRKCFGQIVRPKYFRTG